MTAEESIQLAKSLLGAGKSDDYVISPTTHAEEFKEKAPELSGILNSSAVQITASQYEREDEDAIDAQKVFKKTFYRANRTVWITAILTSLILVVGILATFLPDTIERGLLVALSLGSVITGALASRDIFLMKQGHLLEAWMSKRALAETHRLDYFESVANEPAPGGATDPSHLSLLKLEYFRRFQLDVQRAYYNKRGEQHADEAARIMSYSSWAVAGAAVATGSAGVLVGLFDAHFAAIAALGSVFTGLSTFLSMKEAIFQDRRNAERYGRTSQVLEDLYKRLDDVRNAVLKQGNGPLNSFIEAVHEQLSLEHRQWLGDLSKARGAFHRLEKTLKESSNT